MKFESGGKSLSPLEVRFWVIVNTLLIPVNLFMNVVISTLSGALVGWLVGTTFMGSWIASALNLLHVAAGSGDIFKLSALLGFASCFCKKGSGLKATGV